MYCKRYCEIIQTKLKDIQCGLSPGRRTTYHIFTLQQIFRYLGSITKMSTHGLSIARKNTIGVFVKNCGECSGYDVDGRPLLAVKSVYSC